MQQDYYAILEIAPSASEQEIRAAYRRLARRYHPDLHPEQADADDRLKELNEAYEVLGDPVRRARYLGGQPVRVRVDTAPPASQPSRPRPSSDPSAAPPHQARGIPYVSHVDLSGRRAAWGRGGAVGYGGPWAQRQAPWTRRPLTDEELLVLSLRRLVRALMGW